MIGIVIHTVDTVSNGAAGHIDLAANDRLDTGSLRSLVEINTAIHNAMVSNGDCRLSQFLDPVHHAADPAGAVQEAVFCMNM